MHSTPDNGDQTFNTVTITIGWCVITEIASPTVPSSADTAYTIFSGLKEITLTPQFAQVPACGYPLTEVITWTIPTGTPITEKAGDSYTLQVQSTDGLNHHATSTVIVKNRVTYIAGNQNWEPSIQFDIAVTDPCRTSTITPITINASSAMTVVLGQEALQQFSEAVDSAGTTYSDQTICGPRTYEIVDRTT